MSRHTSKGSQHQRRVSALERKATQHHDFIGEADAERAEAEFRKHERVEADQTHDVVREMASELEANADADVEAADSAFRVPRSMDEAREFVRDAPDRLREKAQERLDNLPEPAQQVLHVAEAAAALMLLPFRVGLWFARECIRLPLGMLRALRQQEV